MKKLTSAAALIAGAIMASQSAHALTPNDLYMGFENASGGGSADYIIDLGPASSLTASGTRITTDLSSYFSLSLFNSSALQGSNPAGIMGGVVGASNANNPADVYLTELRVGGAGPYQDLPGSTAPGGLSRSQDDAVFSDISPMVVPAVGTGLLDSSRSWEHDVEPAFSAGTFYGDSGVNPDSMVSTSTVLYEDLWETSSSSFTGTKPYTYEGYFTLDLTGASPSLTFTATPEPSSYLLSGVGGLLMLVLRNRFSRKNA